MLSIERIWKSRMDRTRKIKMTNELQTFDFEGQDLAIKEINGEVYFNAEQAAIGLGISEIAKSGNVVVKWVRVNKYLGIDTSVDGKIKRGDYITEPQFYKLAIKANNPVTVGYDAERKCQWKNGILLMKTMNGTNKQ